MMSVTFPIVRTERNDLRATQMNLIAFFFPVNFSIKKKISRRIHLSHVIYHYKNEQEVAILCMNKTSRVLLVVFVT